MEFAQDMGTFDGTQYHIPFQIDTVYGRYSDTLHFTQAEISDLTPEQLASQKQARADSWVAFVTAQSNPAE